MTRLRGVFLGCALLWAASAAAVTNITCTSPASAKSEPTEYFVSLADPATHLAHVSIRLTQGEGKRVLDMPVWNALYQVRNFATNIEDVRAMDSDGAPAQVYKVKFSEWEITAPPGCVVVKYDIYLDSGGPFGSMLNGNHAFFNWAMVLMYSPELRNQPMSIHLLDTPTGWGMRDLHVLGAANPGQVDSVTGVAKNYDELADSPVEVGTFQQSQFKQDGATYHIVVDADPADYKMPALEEMLKKITHAEVSWMDDRPYQEYTFLYHLPRGRGAGGMEHAYGTAIEMSADHLNESIGPLASVSAHEFFHLWNVKRIRPQSLEPINYQGENDTRSLWFSEGLTSTVGDLMLVRTGIIPVGGYFGVLSNQISELQRRPAHRWQSAENSGLDAWFEGNVFYRSPDRSISYYDKGEILGVLLDLRIRELTNGRKSLRDLFQWMNQHYAKEHKFFPGSAGVQLAAETVSGHSFVDFFRDYVAGVKEIPYDDFFRYVGLHLVPVQFASGSPGFTTTTNIGGQPEVATVEHGSDAERAGILPGDRIVQLNGEPGDAYFEYRMLTSEPGATITLQLENRRGRRDVTLKLAPRQRLESQLKDVDHVTAEQRARRAAWLHGEAESGAPR